MRPGAKYRTVLKEALLVLVGSVFYTVSINCFLVPNHIVPGGVSGIATLANYLFGFPIGIQIILYNIPIFALGFREMGRGYILKTAAVTLVCSAATDLFSFLPAFNEDRLIASIFGGVSMGLALGFIFSCGVTTGGIDIVASVLKKKNPQFSMGTIILAMDIIIIVLSVAVYGDIQSGFYGVIAMYLSARVVNGIMDGLDRAKLVYIISDRHAEIGGFIDRRLSRGLTLIHGRGFFSGTEREIILVAIRRQQLYSLRSAVKRIDPEAFIILTDATEILGEGFKTKLD